MKHNTQHTLAHCISEGLLRTLYSVDDVSYQKLTEIIDKASEELQKQLKDTLVVDGVPSKITEMVSSRSANSSVINPSINGSINGGSFARIEEKSEEKSKGGWFSRNR